MCVVKCFVSDVHVHKDGLYAHTQSHRHCNPQGFLIILLLT